MQDALTPVRLLRYNSLRIPWAWVFQVASTGMLPELSSLASFMMLFFLSGVVEHTWPFETRLDGKSENKRHMVTLVNPFAWFSNE
jgi:hypothetical protein